MNELTDLLLGFFVHQGGISDTECVSIFSFWMFADVISGSILKPNDTLPLGLFS